MNDKMSFDKFNDENGFKKKKKYDKYMISELVF
jgi:hypothetical protein